MTILLLKKLWNFILLHWKYFLIGCGIILLIIIIFNYKGCGKSEVKINQETINRINTTNEIQRKKELEKIITENSNIIKTVDERTTIAESNVEQRDKLLDEKIKEIDKKITEAKNQGHDVNQEELKCLLIPENCK